MSKVSTKRDFGAREWLRIQKKRARQKSGQGGALAEGEGYLNETREIGESAPPKARGKMRLTSVTDFVFASLAVIMSANLLIPLTLASIVFLETAGVTYRTEKLLGVSICMM